MNQGPRMLSATDRAKALIIANELVTLKASLGRLGLFKTMHALDGATKAIGYEIAEMSE